MNIMGDVRRERQTAEGIEKMDKSDLVDAFIEFEDRIWELEENQNEAVELLQQWMDDYHLHGMSPASETAKLIKRIEGGQDDQT